MNIFKRISSFATNSWREFIDSQEPNILDNEEDNGGLISDSKKPTPEIIHRRSFVNGLLKKRSNKRQTVVKFLEDPRSPTNDFARTPIFNDNLSFHDDILSPFNVKDMLEAVQTAIECTEETLVDLNNQDENNPQENGTKHNSFLFKNDENLLKVDEICNHWDQNEFKEKPLTESLIVELSTAESKDSTLNSIDNEVVDNQDEKNCKVIGYSIKYAVENGENRVQSLLASTPKKSHSVKNTPRTPLMSIGNSPYINKPQKSTKPSYLKKGQVKKRIVGQNRKLPKAPSTPMTPLNRNPIMQQNLIEFDKENF